jgi:hypothetical protein
VYSGRLKYNVVRRYRAAIICQASQSLKGQSHEMFKVLFKYGLLIQAKRESAGGLTKISETPMILD